MGMVYPVAAKAAILNGGFENGFSQWQTLGDTAIVTSASGSSPVEGTFQAFLSTAFDEVIRIDANGNLIHAGNAVNAFNITGTTESLEGFLGTSSFLGNSFDRLATANPIEGSAIKQTFIANAGEILSFTFNFLTDELVGSDADLNFNDYAFVSLKSDSDTLFFPLADTATSPFSKASNTTFFEEIGFQSFSYAVPTTGQYTLGIGIVDVGEPTVISGLLIDQVSQKSLKNVPETSSPLGLLLLGVLGTVVMLKSR
jgi:hypothetical protein